MSREMSNLPVRKSISYNLLPERRDTGISSLRKKSKKDSTGPKPILQKRKRSSVIPLIFEGVDVTPHCLNPYVFEATKERQINILDIPTNRDSRSALTSASRIGSQRFKSEIFQQRVDTEAFNPKSYLTSYCDDVYIEAEQTEPTRTEVSFDYLNNDLNLVDSEERFELIMEKLPKTISLILSETETFFLLELPSSTVLKGGEDGELVEESNRNYEYLTKGKGRNRKVLNAEVQTLPLLMKSRDTEAQRSRFKHNSAFASNWEMYDTYNKVEEVIEPGSSDEEGSDFHKLNEIASLESFRLPSEEKAMSKLAKTQKFQDAVTIIERLLANNCYNEQQKRYKGLSDPYEFREDIEYQYRLNLLWTFANEDSKGKCVIALDFNPFNEDLVAAGYGKFYFTDRIINGAVMLWNVKNPKQPERYYSFGTPVSAVAFSNVNPNLLAVGFYDGYVRILDVSSRILNILKEDSTSFDTVWSLLWYKESDGESLLASFSDGRISKYKFDNSPTPLIFVQIMRTPISEGKLKGIRTLNQCRKNDQTVARYATGRVIVLHPVDPFLYFIASDEGVIHKCSTNYYNQHMDLFRAHDGPIQAIKWSPFADKVFVTCGDDCAMRVWADGIQEPLLEAKIDMNAVADVDWSPTHSTVMVSIRAQTIYVWDYQRKMYESQSRTKSPTNSRNVICRFSPNGRCLMVGDIDGNVHVFALEDMPFPAFFQEDLLKQSMKKVLITKPELLAKFAKLGSLKFDKRQFSKYFN